MEIFVIQVITLSEEKYITLVKKKLASQGYDESVGSSLLWPRRELQIRKMGKTSKKVDSLYPGYVFYRAEKVETEIYHILRRVPGFIRFLKDNHHIEPLPEEDRRILWHFLSNGEVAEPSKVYFDENNRIRIIEGPMKGLEGRIIKVDKRKKRAKVELSLYKERYPIDLGFEIIQPAGEPG